MKVIVIIALSVSLLRGIVKLTQGLDEDEGSMVVAGVIWGIFDTLALVFCCIGWN